VVLDNVFLRATRLFVRADSLDAGHNYWGTSDAAAARSRTAGKVTLEPFLPASAAGF
jgi:hypothetical protein